jgi:hypothetical protein
MVLKFALILLVTWFIGVLGVYDGDLIHVLLLVGLMLLLLGFLKAREAALANRDVDRPPDRG